MAQLPLGALATMGRFLGRTMLWFAPRRRHIAQTNLRLCFPELSATQQHHLLKRHFESLGLSFVETSLAWWATPDRLQSMFDIVGLENLEAAINEGDGVILLGAHYTTLEISGPMLALASPAPICAIYRPHEQPELEQVIVERRKQGVGSVISRDDIKQLVRVLRKNGVVWFASDQNFGLRHSVFSPFFGVMAATNPAPARLAKLTGAKVVPFVSRRISIAPLRYQLELLPALANFPTDDPVHDMNRVNKFIEDQVRTMPEQYLWIHRRFKDRPNNEPSFYT